MIHIEMNCGVCDSFLGLDDEAEDSTPVWFLVYRFADAHSVCGYMTRAKTDGETGQSIDVKPTPPVRRVSRSKRRAVQDEDE